MDRAPFFLFVRIVLPGRAPTLLWAAPEVGGHVSQKPLAGPPSLCKMIVRGLKRSPRNHNRSGRHWPDIWGFWKEPAQWFGGPQSSSRFQPNLVVARLPQPLLTSEIALRRFHRDVAEEKLNLFKFSACRMTEARARPPAVVRCELLNARALRAVPHNVPDDFFR